MWIFRKWIVMKTNTKNIAAGLVFAAVWASASVATKVALHSAQPLVIADCRFFIAGILMLLWAYALRRHRLPQGREWGQLLIYGLLNVTIYLGAFVFAMQQVSAGIGTLGVGTNPLLISVLSALWLRKAVSRNVWFGLILGMLGVLIATYPLLQTSYVTIQGLLILLLSMVSYSVGTVYYSEIEWKLPRLAINAWQILFGGACLLPLTWWLFDPSKNHYNAPFWGGVVWLVLPVSVGAVQLWLYLLKVDAVKASMWLFLCPIFGFLYAALLLGEPISVYTVIGAALVIVGLYVGQQKRRG